MEDACIHTLDLGDGNALFAVFDGHGGKHSFIKASKSANTLVKSSKNNSKNQMHTKRKSTKEH